MDKQTTISVRIDQDLKDEFDIICNDLGLSISSAIIVFAKQVCRQKKIPFEITLIDPPSGSSASNMGRA